MEPKKKKKQLPPIEDGESQYDVLGSYTGTPKDGGAPVQDADDL